MQQCTFRPNQHKKHGERSLNEFLNDQQNFLRRKKDAIIEIRNKQYQEDEGQYFPMISTKSKLINMSKKDEAVTVF